MLYKGIVEIDIVSEEDSVPKVLINRGGYFFEVWRLRSHFIRNSGQGLDVPRNRHPGIDQTLKSSNLAFAIMQHNSNLCNAVISGKTTGSFNIDNGVNRTQTNGLIGGIKVSNLMVTLSQERPAFVSEESKRLYLNLFKIQIP